MLYCFDGNGWTDTLIKFPNNPTGRIDSVAVILNLGGEMKIYPKVPTFFITPQYWLFHVVVLLTTAKK